MATQTETPLLCQRVGAALIVTISRADRGNSLSRATLSAFGALGAQLATDRTCRAVIITGAGERVFCAGADLKERRGMSAEQTRQQLLAYRTELGWLDDCHIPVVAAINGAALGGGAELALLCDLRVAASNASFGFPETALGVIPGAGGTQRLPRLIGESRAKELILLGTRVDARQALDWGLLNRIAPDGEPLIEHTLSWIAPILEGAPIAQRAALLAINSGADQPIERGLQLELEAYEECLNSSDRLEALSAFAEKRKPRFQGR